MAGFFLGQPVRVARWIGETDGAQLGVVDQGGWRTVIRNATAAEAAWVIGKTGRVCAITEQMGRRVIDLDTIEHAHFFPEELEPILPEGHAAGGHETLVDLMDDLENQLATAEAEQAERGTPA